MIVKLESNILPLNNIHVISHKKIKNDIKLRMLNSKFNNELKIRMIILIQQFIRKRLKHISFDTDNDLIHLSANIINKFIRDKLSYLKYEIFKENINRYVDRKTITLEYNELMIKENELKVLKKIKFEKLSRLVDNIVITQSFLLWQKFSLCEL